MFVTAQINTISLKNYLPEPGDNGHPNMSNILISFDKASNEETSVIFSKPYYSVPSPNILHKSV